MSFCIIAWSVGVAMLAGHAIGGACRFVDWFEGRRFRRHFERLSRAPTTRLTAEPAK